MVDPGSIMQEIKKKVILLRNFKNYMTTDALERKDFHFWMCFEMHWTWSSILSRPIRSISKGFANLAKHYIRFCTRSLANHYIWVQVDTDVAHSTATYLSASLRRKCNLQFWLCLNAGWCFNRNVKLEAT